MDDVVGLGGLPTLPGDGPVTGYPMGGSRPTVDLTRSGRNRLAEEDGDKDEEMAEDEEKKEAAEGEEEEDKLSSRRARRNMEERLAEQERNHRRQLARRDAQWEMQRALDVVQSAKNAVRGEGIGDLKLKNNLSDLRFEVMQTFGQEAPDGKGKKDLKFFAGRVESLQKARFDEIKSSGNDGDPLSRGNLAVRGSGASPQDMFDVNRLLRAVRRQALQREGGQAAGAKLKAFDGTVATLDGCPEADVVRMLADRPNTDDQRNHESMARYGPNSLAIPVPWMALHQMGMEAHQRLQTLAQTYGTDGDDTTEPTYRRDLLVPYFRPMENLAWLGATMLTIANNITVPTLSDSLEAQWEGETDDAMEDALTITHVTSAPKRLAVMDTVAWMLLAAADEQFGMMPLVQQEALRAVMQAEELASYVGTGASGQPRGVWNYSGILGANPLLIPAMPDYKGLSAIPDQLATQNITNLEMGAWVTTHPLKTKFKTTLNFANSANSVQLFQSAADPMAMRIPGGRGLLVDFPAAATTQMPTTAGTDASLTGGTNHGLLFGVWSYLLSISYSVAFLTIDDISTAHKAQTRVIVNKFCDSLNRLPKAFVRAVSAP